MNKITSKMFKKGNPKNYNEKFNFWEREKPKIQSDFLCRPFLFNLMN
jgi:hypothetical protein